MARESKHHHNILQIVDASDARIYNATDGTEARSCCDKKA
jgi:hypothetical protein